MCQFSSLLPMWIFVAFNYRNYCEYAGSIAFMWKHLKNYLNRRHGGKERGEREREREEIERLIESVL